MFSKPVHNRTRYSPNASALELHHPPWWRGGDDRAAAMLKCTVRKQDVAMWNGWNCFRIGPTLADFCAQPAAITVQLFEGDPLPWSHSPQHLIGQVGRNVKYCRKSGDFRIRLRDCVASLRAFSEFVTHSRTTVMDHLTLRRPWSFPSCRLIKLRGMLTNCQSGQTKFCGPVTNSSGMSFISFPLWQSEKFRIPNPQNKGYREGPKVGQFARRPHETEAWTLY
jgi:hypothetical protein